MLLENARGTRDIFPEDQILREEVKGKIQKIFSNYGFVPIDTPIIERFDVLSAKFAAGEESDAMSETYRLEDNGKRKLGLRFDLTVPLARFVGMTPNIKLPFKRYQIGKVYRDAPIKFGRYREFTQCDIDIIGSKNMVSDATCINLALDTYTALGLSVKIIVNNRKLLNEIMGLLQIPEELCDGVMISIDKLDKIGKDNVIKEICEKNIKTASAEKLLSILLTEGTNEEKLNIFTNYLNEDSEAIKELKELFSYFETEKRVVFTPSLARGLGYYTGTVFEVEDATGKLTSSIGGGGRYDNLIGSYLGNGKAFPAVGISFGLDRIIDVLKLLNLAKSRSNTTDLFIIPLKTTKECFSIAQTFRKSDIATDFDMMGRNKGKNMKSIITQAIPFVAIIGEDEINENCVLLKNMRTGEENKLSIPKAIEYIKANL